MTDKTLQAAREPELERREASRPYAQAWQCPFCELVNGIPERLECACGAVFDTDTANAERTS